MCWLQIYVLPSIDYIYNYILQNSLESLFTVFIYGASNYIFVVCACMHMYVSLGSHIECALFKLEKK